jgi:molecular chaperone DnaK
MSNKINYGIDLGTTNSAIARMENGEPTIKKTDIGKDTMPSCVSINKKKSVRVGQGAYNNLNSDKRRATKTWNSGDSNTFIEFKRTMGTDKVYESSFMNKEYSSEELSAEILKTLKSFITDDNFNSVVITVPAKFTINQKDATARAASLAGFDHCELLQEPIAASMAYGLDSKNKNGFWLVFDFGGGTFDAALLKVEEGIMKVTDTEGDNWLGGKNLDYAIVDEIIIPYLKDNYVLESILKDDKKREVLREAMKTYAESLKIQLSFKDSEDILSNLGDLGEDDEGEEIELDLTVTRDQVEPVIGPIFQKAVDICKDLLKRNDLTSSSLDSLILVGGPTFSPILRNLLSEQIMEPDTSSDPMTVVANGAALYASTINIPDEIQEKTRDKTKLQIGLGYEPTTVETEEFVTVKILKDKTEGEVPEKVFAEIIRGDNAWSSGKFGIDEVGEVMEVQLNVGKANSFKIHLYDEKGDLIPSEPGDFTILQGTSPGSETLSYHVGIAIKSKQKNYLVFTNILEKNSSTPLTGNTKYPLKTQKDLRPGIKDDFIKIPIYQGEHGADQTRADYNYHVTDIIISGEDINGFLPAGSDVEIIMKYDRSNTLSFSAYFPVLDYTHELERIEINTKGIKSDDLAKMISKAKQTVALIQEEEILDNSSELNKMKDELSELHKRFEQGKGDYDRREQVRDNLIKLLKRLDEIENLSEWPKIEDELKEVFHRLEQTNKEFGNEKSTKAVAQFKEQIPDVIKEKNVKVAQELTENMRHLDFALVDQGLGAQMEIGLLAQFNENFDSHDWSDRQKARMLLNQGLQMASDNPSKQQLRPLVLELYKLLPDVTNNPIKGDDSVLTD